MTTGSGAPELELNRLLSAAGLNVLTPDQVSQFELYLELITRWNERTNLTAVRDRSEILDRHFVECIACAEALPPEIQTVLDLGSGAGLPGVPIAICRPDLELTLAESQGKKAAFLNEVVRRLQLSARVHANRAETINQKFDCVTLRAVDRMSEALKVAVQLAARPGWLAVMSTNEGKQTLIEEVGSSVAWCDPVPLPGSMQRILLLGTLP